MGDWFNNRRLFKPIGNIPPAEAEAACYAQLEVMLMAASYPSQSASGKRGAVQNSWSCWTSWPVAVAGAGAGAGAGLCANG